jgi:hypothetical protein
MFGRLKDWHHMATRYDRCAHTFMTAICSAAVTFWLPKHCAPGLVASHVVVRGIDRLGTRRQRVLLAR